LAYNGVPKSYIDNKDDISQRRLNPNAWSYDSTGKNLSYMTFRRNQETEEFSQPHYEILNDWLASDNLTFKSALFYYTGSGYFNYDGSWTDSTMLRWTSANGYNPTQNPVNALLEGYVADHQGGWLPSMILKHNGGEFTAGLEIRIHRAEHWAKVPFSEYYPSGYDPDFKVYSYTGKRDIFSVFGRERLELSDN